MNVLISLHKGYGLGDAVQMSAVLQHVAKYRPEWVIDYRAEEGRHVVGRGIVHNTFAFGTQPTSEHYDAEVEICLYDTWCNWKDRPNTRVSSCLHERFDLPWNAKYGRYMVNWSRDDGYAAQAAVIMLISRSLPGRTVRHKLSQRAVAVHYQGDSSPDKKNLTNEQADAVCQHIAELGRVPLILDWRNMSPLTQKYCTTGDLEHARQWGGDAGINCAIINQCEAFVGIDSGPAKCASATDVPALVVWTGHHPAPFHDPAPNTTHLVPVGYNGLEPVCNNPDVIKWFEARHQVQQYQRDPVYRVKEWLQRVLK